MGRIRFTMPVILIIFGLSNLAEYLNSQPWTTASLISIAASLLFLAVGMGAVRAYTVMIWPDSSGILYQGTWFSIALWIVSVALHLATNHIGRAGESSLLIYYGITLAVQRWVILSRAKNSFSEIVH